MNCAVLQGRFTAHLGGDGSAGSSGRGCCRRLLLSFERAQLVLETLALLKQHSLPFFPLRIQL